MKFRIDRRLCYAACSALALLAIAWWHGYPAAPRSAGKAGSRGAEKGRRSEAVAVYAEKARRVDVPVSIEAVGTVQAFNTVTVRTHVDGRLMRIAFAEGQDVERGEMLAEIDTALYKARFDQAVAKKAQTEASLENARADLARYEKLVAKNFASKQQFATQQALVSQLEAQVRADDAAIDNVKTTLDYTTIVAPVSGRLGIRRVDQGNILRRDDQTGIVVITQMKPIYVVFNAPQRTLSALQRAFAAGRSPVSALGSDNANVIATGELTVIDNQIDQQTGTVRIKALFENRDLALWPGQFVNVRVVVDTIHDATVVSSPAIQRGPNGAFVYAIGDDEAVVAKPVTIGHQDEGVAVVLSGLQPDARVVISGFPNLTSGAKVRVIEQPSKDKDPAVAKAAGSANRRERAEARRLDAAENATKQ